MVINNDLVNVRKKDLMMEELLDGGTELKASKGWVEEFYQSSIRAIDHAIYSHKYNPLNGRLLVAGGPIMVLFCSIVFLSLSFISFSFPFLSLLFHKEKSLSLLSSSVCLTSFRQGPKVLMLPYGKMYIKCVDYVFYCIELFSFLILQLFPSIVFVYWPPFKDLG